MNDALHPWVKIYSELAIMYDSQLPDWYEAQIEYYTNYIHARPDWEMVFV